MILTKKKFKRRFAAGPKKIKGLAKNKPRKRDWRELMDDEEYSADTPISFDDEE